MKANHIFLLLFIVLVSCTEDLTTGVGKAELVKLSVSEIEIGPTENTITIDTRPMDVIIDIRTFNSLDNWKDIPSILYFDTNGGEYWRGLNLLPVKAPSSFSIANPNNPDETITCKNVVDSTGVITPILQVTFPENKTGKDRYFVFIFSDILGMYQGNVCILQHGKETKK